MHLAEEVMASASANQDGWVLGALKPVQKVPLADSALMFVTVAQKTPFAIPSMDVSAGMDMKETCVISPSPAQYLKTKTQSCLVSQHPTMLDSLWVLSLSFSSP